MEAMETLNTVHEVAVWLGIREALIGQGGGYGVEEVRLCVYGWRGEGEDIVLRSC